MEKQERIDNSEYLTIDVFHILKSLLKFAWLIAIYAVLGAIVGFAIAKFRIAPTYSSAVKLYVNNNSLTLGSTSVKISQADITASQSLVKTYGEILNSRSTWELVIEKSGVDYSWKRLANMVRYEAANETEIMKITVTSTDPNEASLIANTIAIVLPQRISEIINGATMEVVDAAIPDGQKVGPNITKYTAIGLFLGAFAVAAIIAIFDILDDTIHDEEYILGKYDFPILGSVPDLLNAGTKGYYYRNKYYYSKDSKDKSK